METGWGDGLAEDWQKDVLGAGGPAGRDGAILAAPSGWSGVGKVPMQHEGESLIRAYSSVG